MKIQLTTNFGSARDCESYRWFKNLGECQDYCELLVKKFWPSPVHKQMIEEIQNSNVKGLTNLLTSVNKFKFEWVE